MLNRPGVPVRKRPGLVLLPGEVETKAHSPGTPWRGALLWKNSSPCRAAEQQWLTGGLGPAFPLHDSCQQQLPGCRQCIIDNITRGGSPERHPGSSAPVPWRGHRVSLLGIPVPAPSPSRCSLVTQPGVCPKAFICSSHPPGTREPCRERGTPLSSSPHGRGPIPAGFHREQRQ